MFKRIEALDIFVIVAAVIVSLVTVAGFVASVGSPYVWFFGFMMVCVIVSSTLAIEMVVKDIKRRRIYWE